MIKPFYKREREDGSREIDVDYNRVQPLTDALNDLGVEITHQEVCNFVESHLIGKESEAELIYPQVTLITDKKK